jgi:glutathione reductase (NADPH)
MVYGSKFATLYRDAVGYGWSPVQSSFNWSTLIKSVDREVRRLSQIHIDLLAKAGVELISGKATIVDLHTVQVGDRQYTAKNILIAVGGEAVKPDIPGKEYAITSREIFLLPEQPKHITIVGAGYIAVEFAGIMRGLGCQVTQIIRNEMFLRGFDYDVRTSIRDGMVDHGIEIIPIANLKRIKRTTVGLQVVVNERDKDMETVINTDCVLMAIGRAPKLGGLGLENVGIEVIKPDNETMPHLEGYTVNSAIKVDEYSRTNHPHIFAVGDCTNRINLTPVAIGEGRAFADTEFGHIDRVFSHDHVASAVFSQPEAATVGLTEEQAISQYGEEGIKIYRSRFRPMYHSFTGANEKTMMKLIVEKATDRVLGVHMVGDYAAEIIQGMAIAVKMGATKADFDATVGIHPSSAEEFVTMR